MVDSQGWLRLPLYCFFQIALHPLSTPTVASITRGPCHHCYSVLLTCLFFLYSFLITLLMNLHYSDGKESAWNSADPWVRKIPWISSILAWRIPWTEEPDGPHSVGSQRVGHDWVTNTFALICQHLGQNFFRLLVKNKFNLLVWYPKLSTNVASIYHCSFLFHSNRLEHCTLA